VGASLWPRLAVMLQDTLPSLLETAGDAANARLQARVKAAAAQARGRLGGEHQRLEALRRLGNVSAAELDSHGEKVRETLRCLNEAQVSLDSVRVVLLDPRT
jgi:hypothetical protein